MKVTVVGPVYPYRGGIAHYTTTLSQKLSAAGHLVQTVSFKRQYPGWLYPGLSDKDPSEAHDQVPALFTLDPLYFWTWFQAAQQICVFQPDLVVIQWWTTFWSPALGTLARLLRARGMRVVYLIHNVMPHETRFWDRWLALYALSPANLFIVQADREAARLRALLPRANMVNTPLPVYNMLAGNALTRQEARAKLDLPAGVPVVLFFGIVRPYKGLRDLLHAFEILKNKNFRPYLMIAGEFWEPVEKYQQLIGTLGLTAQVHMYNRYIPNEEIPVFFGAADLFAAPYIDGTQSASAKLALGYGLPMVLTRCIVDKTLAGREDVWVAEEHDAESLARAILAAFEQGTGKQSPAREAPDDWNQIVQVIEKLGFGSGDR